MLGIERGRRFVRRDMEELLIGYVARVRARIDPEQGSGGDRFLLQYRPRNGGPAAQPGQGGGMIADRPVGKERAEGGPANLGPAHDEDRKSTRLNSSQ